MPQVLLPSFPGGRYFWLVLTLAPRQSSGYPTFPIIGIEPSSRVRYDFLVNGHSVAGWDLAAIIVVPAIPKANSGRHLRPCCDILRTRIASVG
jgi:hypothetical protein